MRFSEWFKLDEIQHISFQKPIAINGIMTDGIDFRFEDWSLGYNQKNKSDVAKMAPSGAKSFFSSPFSVRLNNGTYLNVNSKSPSYAGTGALSLAANNYEISSEPSEVVLPQQWYDFAIFYLGNNVVKPPEWPRHASEQGKMAELLY